MQSLFFRFLALSILIGAAFILMPVAAAQDPLFNQTQPVRLKITGDFKSLIAKSSRATNPYPGILTVMDVGQIDSSITIAARGRSRRLKSNCRFPPLRIKFDNKPTYPSPFAGQKSLKLVTHCHPAQARQKFVYLEYVSYRLLNQMTPQSLGARLALIDYVQTGTGKTIATRYGFFIEDTDDAAKRNGLKEIDIDDINIADLNPDAAARTSLFQYMLGNLDFSMNAPAAGAECCHNSKLMGASKRATQNLIPVPYDFDSTGFVSAPYAKPPDGVGVRTLRTRLYRGFCVHNPNVRAQARQFLFKKSSLINEIEALSELDGKSKTAAKQFLESFFATLETPATFESKIIRKCR